MMKLYQVRVKNNVKHTNRVIFPRWIPRRELAYKYAKFRDWVTFEPANHYSVEEMGE